MFRLLEQRKVHRDRAFLAGVQNSLSEAMQDRGRCGERASKIGRTRPVNWATDAGSLAEVSPGWSVKCLSGNCSYARKSVVSSPFGANSDGCLRCFRIGSKFLIARLSRVGVANWQLIRCHQLAGAAA